MFTSFPLSDSVSTLLLSAVDFSTLHEEHVTAMFPHTLITDTSR